MRGTRKTWCGWGWGWLQSCTESVCLLEQNQSIWCTPQVLTQPGVQPLGQDKAVWGITDELVLEVPVV